MQSDRKLARFFLLSVIAVVTAVTVVTLRGQSHSALMSIGQDRTAVKKSPQENPLPITTYATSAPADAVAQELRQARGRKYDRRRATPIAELPPGVEELPLNSHWGWGMVALPAAQSDAVVRGEVIDAQAYLSNDKTGIYSEFTVRIGEVLKDFQQAPIADDQQITVEREGGAVKFSSGRIQRYSIANQRMPRVGRQYVLFLKYNEEGKDYSILTGYEIRRGRVIPLDALAQFAAYKNSEEVSFLNAVKDAIARPAQTSKGGEY